MASMPVCCVNSAVLFPHQMRKLTGDLMVNAQCRVFVTHLLLAFQSCLFVLFFLLLAARLPLYDLLLGIDLAQSARLWLCTIYECVMANRRLLAWQSCDEHEVCLCVLVIGRNVRLENGREYTPSRFKSHFYDFSSYIYVSNN